MKSFLSILLISVLGLSIAVASPITPTTVTIAHPALGQAPQVFTYAPTSGAYLMTWRTVISTNYLVIYRYTTQGMTTADNSYSATTYAEMQTKATALGITNLPAKVSGQP